MQTVTLIMFGILYYNSGVLTVSQKDACFFVQVFLVLKSGAGLESLASFLKAILGSSPPNTRRARSISGGSIHQV